MLSTSSWILPKSGGTLLIIHQHIKKPRRSKILEEHLVFEHQRSICPEKRMNDITCIGWWVFQGRLIYLFSSSGRFLRARMVYLCSNDLSKLAMAWSGGDSQICHILLLKLVHSVWALTQPQNVHESGGIKGGTMTMEKKSIDGIAMESKRLGWEDRLARNGKGKCSERWNHILDGHSRVQHSNSWWRLAENETNGKRWSRECKFLSFQVSKQFFLD